MTRLRITTTCFAALILAACGSDSTSPNEQEPEEQLGPGVQGTLVLPAGFALDPSSLRVLTAAGERPILADGRFAVERVGAGAAQVDVITATGELVLIGFINEAGTAVDISPRSTARALLYYALGAFTLPPENQKQVLDLIAAAPQVAQIEAAVGAALLADPTALTNGSDPLLAAVLAARDDIIADAGAPQPIHAAAAVPGGGGAFATMLVQPGAQQSGVELLQNPNGGGLIAQNSYRRPAALLLYQTGFEDASGQRQDVTPPEQVGAMLDIPATLRLGIFSTLEAIIDGTSPFAPETAGPVQLPMHPGAAATFYEAVMVGPSLDFVSPVPILSDPRFPGSVQASWESIMSDLALATFVEAIAWPVFETFIFGGFTALANTARSQVAAQWRAAIDAEQGQALRHILRRGPEYREGIRLMQQGVTSNNPYRLDLLGIVESHMDEAQRLQADFADIDRRLQARASAGLIMSIVTAVLDITDIAAVIHDLQSSTWADSWEIEVRMPRVGMTPNPAQVTAQLRSVTFTASVDGHPNDPFTYRFSSPQQNGYITNDLGATGPVIISSERTVQYITTASFIPSGKVDEVTVEVSVFNDETGQNDDIGTVTVPIMGTAINYTISLDPNPAEVEAGASVQVSAILSPEYQGAGLFFIWNSSEQYGSLFPSAGTLTGFDTVTYTASVSTSGTETIAVEVFDEAMNSLGTATGTIEVTRGEQETPALLNVETYSGVVTPTSCQVRPYFEWVHVEGADRYRLEYLDDGVPRTLNEDHSVRTIVAGGTVLRTGDHFRTLAGYNASGTTGNPADCSPIPPYYEGRFTELKAFAIFK